MRSPRTTAALSEMLANIDADPNATIQRMSDPDWLANDLRRHAAFLNSHRWPLPGPSYHLLANALIWVDEKPPWSTKLRPAEDALRCLLHHRTGLIIG